MSKLVCRLPEAEDLVRHRKMATTPFDNRTQPAGAVAHRQPLSGFKHNHDGFCTACNDYVNLEKHAVQHQDHAGDVRPLTARQAEAAAVYNLVRYG